MNRNDVIDVLSVVAAATRRSVGELDVTIWQGVIGEDDKDLAIQAVGDHLKECPGVWLEPGHVHQRVRGYIRDKLERESNAEREARQNMLESKAVKDDVDQLAARKALPGPVKYARPSTNALLVKCPWCGATAGNRCRVPKTETPLSQFHPSRIDAAKEAAA